MSYQMRKKAACSEPKLVDSEVQVAACNQLSWLVQARCSFTDVTITHRTLQLLLCFNYHEVDQSASGSVKSVNELGFDALQFSEEVYIYYKRHKVKITDTSET
jgi:predicted transport protein